MSYKRVGQLVTLLILAPAVWFWIITPEVQEDSFPLRISASEEGVVQGELLARWLEESGDSIRVDMATFEQIPFNATLVLFQNNPPEGFVEQVVYVGAPFGPDYRLFWTGEEKGVPFQNRIFFQKITWSLEEGKVATRSTRTDWGNVGFASLSLLIARMLGLLVNLILAPVFRRE